MGGHDPGPLVLPAPDEETDQSAPDGSSPDESAPDATRQGAPEGPWGSSADQRPPPADGPWGHAPESAPPQPAPPSAQRPFLPDRPPIDLGGPDRGSTPGPGGKPGG